MNRVGVHGRSSQVLVPSELTSIAIVARLFEAASGSRCIHVDKSFGRQIGALSNDEFVRKTMGSRSIPRKEPLSLSSKGNAKLDVTRESHVNR